MVKKILFISLALFGFLLSVAAGQCFADASSLIEQAEAYRMGGQYEQAEQICKTILKDYPSTDEAFKAQGNLAMVYVLWRKQPEADAAYQVLLSEFSGHKDMPDAVNGVAYQYITVKNYTKAIELYEYVIDNWPDDDRAIWSQTGIVSSNIAFGNYPAAHVAADKLLTDFAGHKSFCEAVRNVASRWRQSGKYIQKANQLDQFVMGNFPESKQAMWALTDLAKYYIEDGNDTDALAATNKLLADFAERKLIEKAVRSLASHYRKLGKKELANPLDQHVADNWPESEQALWALKDLAMSYVELGNEMAVKDAIDRLLVNKHERTAQVVHDIASHYGRLEKYQKADQLYQQVVSNWPQSEHALWSQKRLVISSIEQSNDSAAQAAIDKLLTQFSSHERIAQAVYDIAGRYRDLGKNEKANQLCQLIIDNWPGEEHALWAQRDLARFHIDAGNDTEAQSAIDKLVTKFSRNDRIAQAVRSIASHYRSLGQHEKADQLCHYIVENWAESEHGMWAKRDLSMWNIESGKTSFQAELDGLVADFNDHPTLPGALFSFGEKYYNKAFRCENEGRASEARENFRKAIAAWERIITDLPFSDFTPQAYYLSALCYRRLGEYEVAIEHCRIIVDNWSGYRRAWHAQFMIGRCYEQLERQGGIPPSEATPKIRESYKKLLESYPDCKVAAIAKKWLDRADTN